MRPCGRFPRRNGMGMLALVLLAGCSLAPRYERPAAPVAPRIEPAPVPAAAAARAGGHAADHAVSQAAAGLDWNRFFSDPTLQRLLHRAFADNRDLRVAMQRIEAARAQYGIRRADRLPTISASLSASRMHLPAGVSPGGPALDATEYGATLFLSTWEIDFWGRVRSLQAAALESFLATVDARRSVEVSLVAQIANTYLIERELDERIDDARRALVNREEAYRIMTRRHAVGAISRLDLTQAEILRDQARAELAVLAQQQARARNAMTLLVGAPLPTASAQQAVPLSAVEKSFAIGPPPGLPSSVLLDRPDVQAAEHRLKAAHANIGAARAAFFPRITLIGALGRASSELDGLFGSDTQAWLFVPTVSLPLFDAGRNRANRSLAEALRNGAVADYERTIQTAFREVADALADRRWLSRRQAIEEAIVATQRERVRLAQLRYRSGAASFLEVLEAERAWFAAEQALVQTRRERLASMVSLYAALGGGPGDAGALTEKDRP